MKILLLIFFGGGLGSVLRYLLSKFFTCSFPLGTFLVNIVGCFLIGIAISLFSKSYINKETYLLFAVGFCGGFTTFSSFSAENLELIKQSKFFIFSVYTSVSIIGGIIFIILGNKTAELLLRF